MRLWLVIVFGALLKLSLAQGPNLLESTPACIANCVPQVLQAHSCTPTDPACICTSLALLDAITDCTIQSNCSFIGDQRIAVYDSVQSFCSTYDPRDQAHGIITFSAIFGVISFFVVVLRQFDHPPFTFLFGLDDALLLLAEAALIPHIILLCYTTTLGFGKDLGAVSFSNIIAIAKYIYIIQILYVLTTVTTKLSILFSYTRIFRTKSFLTIVYIVTAINLAYGIATTAAYIFQCHPVSRAWTQEITETSYGCINIQAMIFTVSAINIVLDIIVVGLPIPQVLHLRLTTKKKIQVCLMFCLGLIVTLVSALRLKSNINVLTTLNFTYDLVPITYYSVIETCCSVFCCCMPTLARLYKRYFGGPEATPVQSYFKGPSTTAATATIKSQNVREFEEQRHQQQQQVQLGRNDEIS